MYSMINQEVIANIPVFAPGIPPQYGIKQPSPPFVQGCDVLLYLPIYLTTPDGDSSPLVDPTGWNMEVIVKKSTQANNQLWTGSLDKGFYHQKTNIYLLRIPADITATLTPGTYFYAIKGIKLVNTSGFSITTPLGSGTFEVTVDASSPNSKLFGPNDLNGDIENTEPLLITDLPMAGGTDFILGL